MKRFIRRFIGPKGSRRTGRLVLAPILVAALVALLSVGAARAVHDLGLFELDNNTVNGVGAGDDWDQVFADEQAGACDTIGIACTFVTDPANETIFTGGGSKDDLDITQWQHSSGSVPDKDELTNAYATLYSTGGSSPQAVLYFGADRFAQNGSANLGFWFFKSPVSLNPNGTFSGVHSVGDLLILSEFTNGGAVSTIKAFEWVGSGGDTNGTLQSVTLGPAGTPADCDAIAAGATHNACATVNGAGIQPAWPYTPKSGPSGTIPPGGFFEGGVNLSALGLAGCFSSFLAETRSSPSVDAVLKDFVTGSFTPCSARISIAPPTDTNEVNQQHVLTVKVQKEDPSTGFSLGPAAGVEVTGTITSGPGSFVNGDNTCTTNANGECTLTITSALPGVTTVSASASVTLSEGTVLAVSTDGVAPNSGPAMKRWVDGRISVSPLVDTNEITDEHTVTATVEQDDGLPATTGDGVDGFAPVSDATVTFSLLNNTAGAVFVPPGVNTCVTGADGKCSIQITSNTTGSVDIRATSTYSVGGVELIRTTGTGVPNSADANKRFVNGRISVSPLVDTNEITDHHTITATVEEDDGLAPDGFDPVSGATVTFTLLSNTAGAVFVDGVNTCVTGADGTCSIQITSNTTGSVDIRATSTFNVDGVSLTRTTGTGAPNSADANKRFVNGRISVSPLVDTNEITDDHTVTATVERDDGLPATTGDGVDGFAPVPDATVTFSLLNNTANAVFVPAGDNTCVTGVDGKCSIQITSDTAGSVDIRATSTFTVDGVELIRTTGTGVPNSADANKRFVDGRISINPPTDTNGITETHTLAATVEEDDGLAPDGFDPVSGATVTFTLLNNTAGAVFVGGVSTCTTGADGQCSAQITSSTAGSVDIQASSTWVLDGVTLIRTTGTGAPNSGNANKVFVDGTLRWLKHDQDGNLLGGATFEVCRTHDFNSATGEFDDITPDVCVTVLDNSAPDADPDAGEFQLDHLVLGRYRITETSPPPGYAGDPNSQTVELTVANPSNTTNPPVFVNEQLFKVIVITCNDSVNPEELVDSTVMLNGEQKETITEVPADLALKGVTEADLCAIGGASYGDLPANPNLGATIELPDVAPLFPPTP